MSVLAEAPSKVDRKIAVTTTSDPIIDHLSDSDRERMRGVGHLIELTPLDRLRICDDATLAIEGRLPFHRYPPAFHGHPPCKAA